MFKPKHYRAKATEYGDLAKSSIGSNQSGDFQKLERDSRCSRIMNNCSQIIIKTP